MLFPLFSDVFWIPQLVAGRVENEKSEENSVFNTVFRDYCHLFVIPVHFLRIRGRLRRGSNLWKSYEKMIGKGVPDFTFDFSGL